MRAIIHGRLGIVVAAVLAAGAARAHGQQVCNDPVAAATFFEVAETIECNPGGSADPAADPFCLQEVSRGLGARLADARLEGTIDGPPGFAGEAVVRASSVLSRVDWTGPAHGTIQVGGSRLRFSGQLDLSRARQGVPLAPIAGRWHGTRGLRAGGAFTGTFFVPFACPPESGLSGACYLRLDEQGNVAGVVPAELRDGVPLVRLDVTFCGR
jgi:hypothetical protein